MFFLPAQAGARHHNNYMPTVFLPSRQKKRFPASNNPCLRESSSFTPSPRPTHRDEGRKGQQFLNWWLALPSQGTKPLVERTEGGIVEVKLSAHGYVFLCQFLTQHKTE